MKYEYIVYEQAVYERVTNKKKLYLGLMVIGKTRGIFSFQRSKKRQKWIMGLSCDIE